VAAYEALDAAIARVRALGCEAMTTPELFNLLERNERVRRALPVADHQMINLIAEHATPAEIGGALVQVLADRLRITGAEAARRIGDAEQLGPRMSITGQRLEPLMAVTAAGALSSVLCK